MLSNIVAGEAEQVEAVKKAGLFPSVIRNISAPEFEVKKEAIWFVANLTTTTDEARTRFLIEDCNVLEALCDGALGEHDGRLCSIALEAIENLLMDGEKLKTSDEGRNPYADRLEQIGGKEKIQKLCSHIDEDVVDKAQSILDAFFDGETVRSPSLMRSFPKALQHYW